MVVTVVATEGGPEAAGAGVLEEMVSVAMGHEVVEVEVDMETTEEDRNGPSAKLLNTEASACGLNCRSTSPAFGLKPL